MTVPVDAGPVDAVAAFVPADPPRTGVLRLGGERLTMVEALPRLLDGGEPGRFWAAAARAALGLVARGRILPGVSPAGFNAWRAGPLDPSDAAHLRSLAAAMPPDARVDDGSGFLHAAAPLVRAFVDAMVDAVVRVPGSPAAFAAETPVAVPELREWAAEVAAGVDAGVRVSLRLDGDPATRMRVVVQVHALDDPTRLADLADVWSGAAVGFGPDSRVDAVRAVRRAARFWGPLEQLLTQAVPDASELADTDLADLLDSGAAALATAGISVHRPPGAHPDDPVGGHRDRAVPAGSEPLPARLGGRAGRGPAHRRPNATSWPAATGRSCGCAASGCWSTPPPGAGPACPPRCRCRSSPRWGPR